MSITAKVTCNSKVLYSVGTTYETVVLGFVADYANGANKEWAASTPSLNFVQTVKPEVAKEFEIGDKFTVTFKKEVPDGVNETA